MVTLDKGAADRLDVGTVLAIYRVIPLVADPRIVSARSSGRSSTCRSLAQIPDERIGLLFVFRVLDRCSYTLVLNTTTPSSSAITPAIPSRRSANALRA